MRYLIAAAGIICAAGACVPPTSLTPVPRAIEISGDPAEYSKYAAGDVTLTGQAFLTTRGGDVKLAAGRSVTLDPATTYAREWFRRFGAEVLSFDVLPPDTLFRRARRTATADAEGRFKFTNVAPGEYIVRTTVTWEVGSSYAAIQGGVVASLVDVQRQAPNEFVVSTAVTPNTVAMLGVGIVTAEDLAARPHKVLGRATGLSCQVGFGGSPPAESAARDNLVLEAAKLGAEDVANVACAQHGMSMRPNCAARIECTGDAVDWLS